VKTDLDSSLESLSSVDSDSTSSRVYGIDSRYMPPDRATHSNSERKTRAVLYARVSSDAQQKEGTIESQVVLLRRQIATAGHELVKEYIDGRIHGDAAISPRA
jgi:hypothetical protein